MTRHPLPVSSLHGKPDFGTFDIGVEHTTCFCGSEILLPPGYTKGRCPRASAFSRSIASSGNDLRQWVGARGLSVAGKRDTHMATGVGGFGAILARSLGCLCVSPGPGYQDVRSALPGRNGQRTDGRLMHIPAAVAFTYASYEASQIVGG